MDNDQDPVYSKAFKQKGKECMRITGSLVLLAWEFASLLQAQLSYQQVECKRRQTPGKS